MDLYRVSESVTTNILTSQYFPYRTGQLRDNFFEKDVQFEGERQVSVGMLSNPIVKYGMILENAPTIRYRLRKVGKGQYSYIKHRNRHFRYIDKCIELSAIPALENDLGVKLV